MINNIKQIKKLTDKIVHVIYKDKILMNTACIRINNYLDNPKFNGKIFTLGQIREWYIQEKGVFDYHTRVYGTNIGRTTLEPFINGLFDPLSPEELELVELFRHRRDDFFILVTFDEESMENQATFNHELAHGLWYTDSEYRKKATEIVKKYKSQLKDVYKYLKKAGYSQTIFTDECQAFVSADYDWLKIQNVKVPYKMSLELQKLIKERVKL